MAAPTIDHPRPAVGRRPFRFDRREVRPLAGMYGSAALLTLVAWALFLHYQHSYGAAYAASGSLAFGLGVRQAFDADHISAIDDTTRYLLQQQKKRHSVGYFFSLGHSTVVVGLTLAIAISAEAVQRQIPRLQADGSTFGSLVSGLFLFLIAVLDLFVLLSLLDVWRKAKLGTYRQQELDELMMQRGFINRVLGRRWRRLISDSWQMFPVGMLFGLGFDTATQVGVIALTAAAATGHLGSAGHHQTPLGALLALPLLFTAGMVIMDTTDGVVMAEAYGWAFMSPFRKVYYNIATVALGIFVAGAVGTIELLRVLSTNAQWKSGLWGDLNRLDFEKLGYGIVGAFIVLWLAAVFSYRFFHFEQRYGARDGVSTSGRTVRHFGR